MGEIHNRAEDERAVAMLLDLPDPARVWISHHFRNSLQAAMAGIERDRMDVIKKAVLHMLEDLDRIGC